MKPTWLNAADFAGLSFDPDRVALMGRYRDWLITEGVTGGGIGPSEVARIDRRHLGDSLLFASQIPPATSDVWDLGSGAGLPGIPLAIAMPAVSFTLIDRSRRRIDLLKRVIRILDLENCQVTQGEISDVSGAPDVIVSRASLPPDRLLEVARRHLRPGGVVVAGGSWREAPRHPGWTSIEIPSHVLDQTVWLLIMRRE